MDYTPVSGIERRVKVLRTLAVRRPEIAQKKYAEALSIIDEALKERSISLPDAQLRPGLVDVDAQKAADTAELLGMRGGILRRMGKLKEAMRSYRSGAEIEERLKLPATYNRANAIKLALIANVQTVGQSHDELVALHSALNHRLSNDVEAADDAWLWADLGDVRLLLGDHAGAESAYLTFDDKARTSSRKLTLDFLGQIVEALNSHDDPDAERIAASVASIKKTLAAREQNTQGSGI